MANKKKKISFEDSLDDTDFGLIISAKGELKGMYIPDQMNEMDYMPKKLCKSRRCVWYGYCNRFGNYTLMRRERKRNSRIY